MNKPIGQVEISFTFSRHLGPRFVHGAVTLQFDSLQKYSFSSSARWPEGENYDDAIRIAVEETLKNSQGHLESPAVLLKQIQWDEISSCEAGFKNAAKAATAAAF